MTLNGHTLTINEKARVAAVDGVPVTLTRKEYRLLVVLALDPERCYTYPEIARFVWDATPATEHMYRGTITSHAHRLRKVLVHAGMPRLLEAVWADGYRLLPAEAVAA